MAERSGEFAGNRLFWMKPLAAAEAECLLVEAQGFDVAAVESGRFGAQQHPSV